MPNLHRGALDAQSPSRAAAAEQEAFEREVEALRAANARVRIELAEVKYELAWRRFVRKYSPDQPRVPAGNPDGGQWTNGGGAFFGRRDNSPNQAVASSQRTRVAQLVAPGASVSDAGFSPSKPGWHDFTAGPSLACRPEWRCSREEMADQLARFSVPGRDPANPVQEGDRSIVYDPKTGLPGGVVDTTVSGDGLTIVNRTSPAHVFYNGVVIRTASQSDDGAWYVTTRGFGNNVVPGMNILNQEEGPVTFRILDQRLRENIERHHAKGIFHLAMRRLDCGRLDAPRALLAGPSHVR